MGGWMIGYSLPNELDAALYYATSRENLVFPRLPPNVATLLQSLTPEWYEEWEQLSPTPLSSFSVLELMGDWANTVFEGDFRRATLPMRELRLKDAIEMRAAQLKDYGESLPPIKQDLETLQALEFQAHLMLYREEGFSTPNEAILKRRIMGEVERTATFLRDGEKHTPFWFFIDRFYYETYLPWRNSRMTYMEALAQRAALVLGGTPILPDKRPPLPAEFQIHFGKQSPLSPPPETFPSGVLYYSTVAPNTDWLPTQNILRSSSKVAERVQQGKNMVYFWVEPFELFDSSFMEPGIVGTSFAEPGVSFDNFIKFMDSLSSRAQAFADPTRLVIMRMMRHFSLDNTTMSNYMGISRPTVSEHARILREAGFIQTYQEGRQARHEIQPEAVAQFVRDLLQFLDLDIEVK